MMAALATGGRAEKLSHAINGGIGAMFAKAGFRLKAVRVEGASAMATADIVRAADLYKDKPLIGLDLEGLRRQVQQVGWVREAKVARLLPDTLVISIQERRQQAVWQFGGHSVVIDDHGQVIPEADPSRFARLPLVVGEGAARHAAGILPILAQRPKLMAQVDAVVRVDDRRWDLRLKDGSLIQLPAVAEEEALMRLEQLDQRSRILELGFERIDLRNPDVVAVRPREGGAPTPLLAGGA
jgi:cell division protein FtsQ